MNTAHLPGFSPHRFQTLADLPPAAAGGPAAWAQKAQTVNFPSEDGKTTLVAYHVRAVRRARIRRW
jgi:hypothetical protein